MREHENVGGELLEAAPQIMNLQGRVVCSGIVDAHGMRDSLFRIILTDEITA